MVGARCVANMRGVRPTHKITVGNVKEKEHLEDLDIVGSIILKFMEKFVEKFWIRIRLPQYSNQWRALVNIVMSL
jgi:hypothetical protein